MDAKILALLPSTATFLATSIEAHTGFTIRVEQDRSPRNETALNPDAAAVQVDVDSATILVADLEDIDPASIVHELLHVKRFLVDGIPQLRAGDLVFNPSFPREFHDLDNILEHLVIVPQEASYGADRPSYWDQLMFRFWREHPRQEAGYHRRRDSLMGWLTTVRLTVDPTVRELAVQKLMAEELDSANQFNSELSAVCDDKRRAVIATFSALSLNVDLAELHYLDPRTGPRVEPLQPGELQSRN